MEQPPFPIQRPESVSPEQATEAGILFGLPDEATEQRVAPNKEVEDNTELDRSHQDDVEDPLEDAECDLPALLEAWQASTEVGVPLAENLSTARALEKLAPGAVGFLQRECNIEHFGRYPLNLLIEMYEDRMKPGPAGLIIYAKSDHNNALYNQGPVQELHRVLGDNHSLKVVEVESTEEAGEVLSKFSERYGALSFGVIYAHGNPEGICFGDDETEGVLTKKSVRQSFGQSLDDSLADDAEICLASCSTAVRDGIGEKIAHSSDRDAVGPDAEASLLSFGATLVGRHVSFAPEYRGAQRRRLYAAA